MAKVKKLKTKEELFKEYTKINDKLLKLHSNLRDLGIETHHMSLVMLPDKDGSVAHSLSVLGNSQLLAYGIVKGYDRMGNFSDVFNLQKGIDISIKHILNEK